MKSLGKRLLQEVAADTVGGEAVEGLKTNPAFNDYWYNHIIELCYLQTKLYLLKLSQLDYLGWKESVHAGDLKNYKKNEIHWRINRITYILPSWACISLIQPFIHPLIHPSNYTLTTHLPVIKKRNSQQICCLIEHDNISQL